MTSDTGKTMGCILEVKLVYWVVFAERGDVTTVRVGKNRRDLFGDAVFLGDV